MAGEFGMPGPDAAATRMIEPEGVSLGTAALTTSTNPLRLSKLRSSWAFASWVIDAFRASSSATSVSLSFDASQHAPSVRAWIGFW
jgi:hypothetical protein